MTEYFETFKDDGSPAGLVQRSEVHRRGLWHRSVNVFLFHPDGRMYLQLRAQDKDVWPNAWDMAVGEHLKPGETSHQAALRGLQEELNICGIPLQPWGSETRYKTVDETKGIHDFELQQCFRGEYDGPIRIDPAEVADVRLMALDEVQKRLRTEAESFTPWMRFWLTNLIPIGDNAGD